jgi:hypothetical protein
VSSSVPESHGGDGVSCMARQRAGGAGISDTASSASMRDEQAGWGTEDDTASASQSAGTGRGGRMAERRSFSAPARSVATQGDRQSIAPGSAHSLGKSRASRSHKTEYGMGPTPSIVDSPMNWFLRLQHSRSPEESKRPAVWRINLVSTWPNGTLLSAWTFGFRGLGVEFEKRT